MEHTIPTWTKRTHGMIPTQLGACIAAATWLMAAGCSQEPVLTLQNQSSLNLSNVVVSGTGFSQRIASIPAGGSHRLRVQTQGESSVRVSFDAGGQHVDSGPQGYLEAAGGYRLKVIVGTNLNVSVSEDRGSD